MYTELIATATVGSGGASSIDFNLLPSTYTDLHLVCHVRHNATAVAQMKIEFNSSSSTFNALVIQGNGGSATSFSYNSNNAGMIQGSSSTANVFSTAQIYIPNYTNSKKKPYTSMATTEANGVVAYQNIVAGIWDNTSQITRITIRPSSGSFVQNSSISLYGITKGSGGATVS